MPGTGGTAVRCRAVEASRDPQSVLEDVQPVDDAVASAAYRRDVLPVLVRQALERLELRMNLTVNGVEYDISSPPLTTLLRVLREELDITSPKAGCEQGGCGTLHRPRRRRAAPRRA